MCFFCFSSFFFLLTINFVRIKVIIFFLLLSPLFQTVWYQRSFDVCDISLFVLMSVFVHHWCCLVLFICVVHCVLYLIMQPWSSFFGCTEHITVFIWSSLTDGNDGFGFLNHLICATKFFFYWSEMKKVCFQFLKYFLLSLWDTTVRSYFSHTHTKKQT